MSTQFFLDLGFVIDREGNKVAATMRTEQWGAETVYVVALGEKADGFWLNVLFTYLLRDGVRDFEILRDDCPRVAHRIPPGEMRALVRRIMGRQHRVGSAALTVHLDTQVFLVEPRSVQLECPF